MGGDWSELGASVCGLVIGGQCDLSGEECAERDADDDADAQQVASWPTDAPPPLPLFHPLRYSSPYTRTMPTYSATQFDKAVELMCALSLSLSSLCLSRSLPPSDQCTEPPLSCHAYPRQQRRPPQGRPRPADPG